MRRAITTLILIAALATFACLPAQAQTVTGGWPTFARGISLDARLNHRRANVGYSPISQPTLGVMCILALCRSASSASRNRSSRTS
jgi:hypothetical protein